MRFRDASVAISLVILSSVTGASGTNYIQSSPIPPRETMVTRSQSDTNAHLQPREQQRANGNDTVREKKTLVLLLLMLRDGRGVR